MVSHQPLRIAQLLRVYSLGMNDHAAAHEVQEPTMTQHTPGPWNVDGAEITDGKEPLALCCSTEANARLIAAAPELLEALEACVEYIGAQWADDPENRPNALRMAEAATAKVTSAPPDPDHA